MKNIPVISIIIMFVVMLTINVMSVQPASQEIPLQEISVVNFPDYFNPQPESMSTDNPRDIPRHELPDPYPNMLTCPSQIITQGKTDYYVYFFSPDCPGCVGFYEQITEYNADSLPIYAMDISKLDNEQKKVVIDEFGIRSIPTVLLIADGYYVRISNAEIKNNI